MFKRIKKNKEIKKIPFYDGWIECSGEKDEFEENEKIIKSLNINFIDNWTEEELMRGINRNPLFLAIIPKQLLTSDICLIAVRDNPKCLKYVPTIFKTDQLCYKALTDDIESIKFVNDNILTQELIENLLKEGEIEPHHLPKKFQTKDLYMFYGENTLRCAFEALNDVPLNFRDKEICMAYYNNSKSNIRFFPNKLQTKELWNDAIQDFGYLIKCIPQNFVSVNSYRYAIEGDIDNFIYVPEENKTFEFCTFVLKQAKKKDDEKKQLGFYTNYSKEYVLDLIPEEIKHKVLLYANNS